MHVSWLSVLVVALSLPALAHAEVPEDPVEPSVMASQAAPSQDAPMAQPRPFTYQRREIPPIPKIPVAVGVNSPLGWYRGAIAASVYVGLSQHVAIRGNFAYYEPADWGEAAVGALGGGEIPSYRGRIIDYGAAAVWYPRQRWEGFMLEGGALLRDREIRASHEEEIVKNWTTTFAARGMIGWSWHLGPTFVAAAVGFSAGYESGTELVAPRDSFSRMPTVTRHLSRLQVDGEAYLRIGWVLGD